MRRVSRSCMRGCGLRSLLVEGAFGYCGWVLWVWLEACVVGERASGIAPLPRRRRLGGWWRCVGAPGHRRNTGRPGGRERGRAAVKSSLAKLGKTLWSGKRRGGCGKTVVVGFCGEVLWAGLGGR